MEEKRFWNSEIETMPLEKLEKMQEEKLQRSVEWAYKHTRYYHKLLDEAGVKPSDIRSLKDIVKLPFTYDVEVSTDIPMADRLGVPEDQIGMFHSTSGTMGAVVPIPFTRREADLFFKEGEGRARWTMGVRIGRAHV